MDHAADFNLWLKKLECPQSYTPDHVVETLQKGVLGILWEDLPKVVRPYSEVIETRKNILLYKLKNEPKDSLIQSVRDTSYLADERKKLAAKIKAAEETWKQEEYLCRQKAHALEKKRSEKKKFSVKKEILKIKLEQMLMEIENCKKMKGVCQHLMPATVEEISQSVVADCLSLVSNYSGGPEKRKVWTQISETLDPVKIPVIYNALLSLRSYYTDYLINLDIEENQENIHDKGKYMDHGIAKLWSEHFANKAQCVIYENRKKNNEKKIISYVESIEQIINELRPELTDWLPLTLEVKKLELWQIELEKELAKLEEELPEQQVSIDDTLNQLIMEIKVVDDEIIDCVQKVKNTFGYLKSSRSLITKAKESLLSELEKLKLLETNNENQWHCIDLNTELIDFHNNVDLNALRKIVLKGKAGTYRHLHTCYNQAPIIVNGCTTNGKISMFPMLRVPIYYLLDFYKTVLANADLNKRVNEETLCSFEESLESLTSSTIVAFPHRGIMELLRQADLRRNKTQQHSEDYERILKAWSEQSVREIVPKVFPDKTVYRATLEEWQKRFSMIVYVLQKSNINIV